MAAPSEKVPRSASILANQSGEVIFDGFLIGRRIRLTALFAEKVYRHDLEARPITAMISPLATAMLKKGSRIIMNALRTLSKSERAESIEHTQLILISKASKARPV